MNTSERDDGQVIEASWSEPAAFSVLFDRHYRAIRLFCGRRVGWDDADDLAGETFCRAFEHRRLYDTQRAVAVPWLFGIAANVIRTHQRSRSRAASAYEREARLGGETTEVSGLAARSIDARDDLALVAASLPTLPEEEVDVLLMHVWEELSYEDIAVALEIPVGTVRSRLHRVRQRLRVLIEAGGHPAGSASAEAEVSTSHRRNT